MNTNRIKMLNNKAVMSLTKQRHPAVIFVAADVHAVHSHISDQISAPTSMDVFEKFIF